MDSMHGEIQAGTEALAQDKQDKEAAALDEKVELVDKATQSRVQAPGTHPAFDRLVRTIWRLRQSDGCPWDREQTHTSIARDLIGEAYEALETILEADSKHFKEELGDVLEQVLLHAQIAADEGEFDIDSVCDELNRKLIRRHPHVFGEDGHAPDTAAVLDIWDQVKAQERAVTDTRGAERPQGLLDSIPHSLPALMQCQKISKRAAKLGFEWDSVEAVWQQVASERQEFEAEERGSTEASEEFGDLLFSMVNVARHEGIDAEAALESSNRKFRRRWSRMEEIAYEHGYSLEELDTAAQNELWEQVKAEERKANDVGRSANDVSCGASDGGHGANDE